MASINTNFLETSSDPAQTSAVSDGVTMKRKRRQAGPFTIVTEVKQTKAEARTGTKTDAVLKKLKGAKGVTLEALMEATGWQAHSVRGFLPSSAYVEAGHDARGNAAEVKAANVVRMVRWPRAG